MMSTDITELLDKEVNICLMIVVKKTEMGRIMMITYVLIVKYKEII